MYCGRWGMASSPPQGPLRVDAEPFVPNEAALDVRRPPRIRTASHDVDATLYEVLDAVPFTPSMGVCTPTPTNRAIFHQDRHQHNWSASSMLDSPRSYTKAGDVPVSNIPTYGSGHPESGGGWSYQILTTCPPSPGCYPVGSFSPQPHPQPPPSPDRWLSHSTSPMTPPGVPPYASFWTSHSPPSPQAMTQQPWIQPLITGGFPGGYFLPPTTFGSIWSQSPQHLRPSVHDEHFGRQCVPSAGPPPMGQSHAGPSGPQPVDNAEEHKSSPKEKKGKSKGQQCPEVGPNGELKLNARQRRTLRRAQERALQGLDQAIARLKSGTPESRGSNTT